jgi:hypothetical protein
MALAITPATSIVRPRGSVTFVATGGTGPYTFAFAAAGDNASGATLNGSTGAYVAGPKSIVDDIVTVTDSVAATATAAVSISGTLYRTYQSNLIQTGDWQGANIKLLESDLGTEKDIEYERARQGMLSNNPITCPPDALPYIGQERGLPQAVGETTANYRLRLKAAWDRADGWLFAGSHGSLLFALQRAGFPQGDPAGAHIMQHIKLYSWLVGSTVTFGTHVDWGFGAPLPSQWQQFGIIFGADVAGLSAGTALANVLNTLVAAWKPAKAQYMGCWVVVSGSIWGWPIGVTWGAGGRTWGGTSRFIPGF